MGWRAWGFGVLYVAGCVLALFVVVSSPSLALTVTPRVGLAPLTVRVSASLAYDDRNREMCVGIDSENGYSRSSCWGTISVPSTTILVYPDLPVGDYLAHGAVARVDGTIARSVSVPFSVY